MALIVGTALIPHVSLAERPGTLTDPWGWENVQRCLSVAVASAYAAQLSPPVGWIYRFGSSMGSSGRATG
jgi:hypothetical protein